MQGRSERARAGGRGMADPELLPQMPRVLPVKLPEPPERLRSLFSRWASKATGGTASTRGYIISLLSMIAIVTVAGQLLHLSDIRATDPQTVFEPPALPPQLSPTMPPPLPEGAPLLPPFSPSPPSLPSPAPPPMDWWQRRLPLATELNIARWELAALILLCIVMPTVLLGYRNYKRRRDAYRDIIRRRSSAMAANRAQQQGDESPQHSPGGPVGAPKGSRRGSHFMNVEVMPAPPDGLALSGRVLP